MEYAIALMRRIGLVSCVVFVTATSVLWLTTLARPVRYEWEQAPGALYFYG
jgi:hypothetical protein